MRKLWKEAAYLKILQDYQGRAVRLTDERLQHVLEHPEMASMSAAIEEAVRHPERVVRSRADSDAELLYRYHYGTKVGDKWLCVVVKYSTDDAFVVTAYLTDRVKKGETLWPRK